MKGSVQVVVELEQKRDGHRADEDHVNLALLREDLGDDVRVEGDEEEGPSRMHQQPEDEQRAVLEALLHIRVPSVPDEGGEECRGVEELARIGQHREDHDGHGEDGGEDAHLLGEGDG